MSDRHLDLLRKSGLLDIKINRPEDIFSDIPDHLFNDFYDLREKYKDYRVAFDRYCSHFIIEAAKRDKLKFNIGQFKDQAPLKHSSRYK